MVARRSLALGLLAGVLLGAVVVGAVSFLGADASPATDVPDNATYVGHVEADRLPEEPAERNATSDALAFQSTLRAYDGPRFERSVLFRESSLDAEAVAEVTFYGQVESDYHARIVVADWDPDDVVAAVEADHDVTLQEDTYGSSTIYTSEDGAVAVAVHESRFVIGTEPAVRDAVDVADGETPALSGAVREAFDDEREGYVRFAHPFDPSSVPDSRLVDTGGFDRVEVVSGVHYREADELGVQATLHTDDRAAAGNVAGLLETGVSLYAAATEDRALADELDAIEIDREGDRAVIRWTGDPEGLRTLIEGLRRLP